MNTYLRRNTESSTACFSHNFERKGWENSLNPIQNVWYYYTINVGLYTYILCALLLFWNLFILVARQVFFTLKISVIFKYFSFFIFSHRLNNLSCMYIQNYCIHLYASGLETEFIKSFFYTSFNFSPILSRVG